MSGEALNQLPPGRPLRVHPWFAVAASARCYWTPRMLNTPSRQGRTFSQRTAAGHCGSASRRKSQLLSSYHISHALRITVIMLWLQQSIRWLFSQMLPGEYLQDCDTKKKKKKNADSPINSLIDKAQSGLRLQLYHRGASGITVSSQKGSHGFYASWTHRIFMFNSKRNLLLLGQCISLFSSRNANFTCLESILRIISRHVWPMKDTWCF